MQTGLLGDPPASTDTHPPPRRGSGNRSGPGKSGCCGSRINKEVRPPVSPTPAELSSYDDGRPVFGTTRDYEHPIRYSGSGMASEREIPSATLPALFARAAEKAGDRVALRVERDASGEAPAVVHGQPPPPPLAAAAWQTWTYRQFYEQACAIGKAFMELGVEQYDSVAIFGFNSPEWFIATHGAILCAAKSAGIYPTDTAAQVKFKVAHSGSKVMVLEDDATLRSFQTVAGELPKCTTVVIWRPQQAEYQPLANGQRVLTWSQLLAMGQASTTDLISRTALIRPGHCCTLIYTSGTTGNPKAVMVSHDNIVFESTNVVIMLRDIVGTGSPDDEERVVSYLPLSHVAGMMVDIVCPLVLTADPRPCYANVSFARPYDLKLGSIKDRLQSVRPTMFLGAFIHSF